MVIISPETKRRGPRAAPSLMAFLAAKATFLTAPASTRLVHPAIRALLASSTPLTVKYSSLYSTGSGTPVYLMWTWASMSPGITMRSPRSMTSS